MTSSPYRLKEQETAIGISIICEGPGMPRYLSLHVAQPMNEWATKCVDNAYRKRTQEILLHWIRLAYEAGRQSIAEDVRKLLGAKG